LQGNRHDANSGAENYWSVLLLLNQSFSDVRQKRLLVGSDRLADVVITQRFLIAFWKAGHEPIQLIFDFCPIPIVHRLPLPRSSDAGSLSQFEGRRPRHCVCG
jgi:hypothetical protein